MARKKRDDAVALVLRDYSDRKDFQTQFVDRYDRQKKAYMGLYTERSPVRQWDVHYTPKYAMQIVEGVVANLVDDRTRFMVRPKPRLASSEELQSLAKGARAHEILLSYQLDRDAFNEKQRPFILQDLICGVTGAKVFWRRQRGKRRERAYVPIINSAGDHLMDERGQERYSVQTRERTGYIIDDPTIEVLDMRDFLYEEAAKTLDNSWCAHRVYYTIEELEELERQGEYKNVSKLRVVGAEEDERRQIGMRDEFSYLEDELWGEDRAKGRIEVIEYWTRDGKRVITIGNRRVLLADEENPFWHGMKPFIVASTSPDMFRIPGFSLVDKVRSIQEFLWTLGSQRIMNLELQNNAIFLISEMLDHEQFDFYPGAQWSVQSPDQVKWFTPDPTSARISIEAEAMMKGDLQNITGGYPMLAGSDKSNLTDATATGASIATTIAQRMVAHLKQHVNWAYERIGDMMVSLNQQFITEKRVVSMVGPDSMPSFFEVYPEDIQGEWHCNLTAASESMIRQERRAEEQAKLTVAGNLAPIFAALAQANPQQFPMLNMKAFMEDFLRAYDVDDMERFFSLMKPAIPPSGGQTNGNAPTDPTQLQASGLGVTSPLATDVNSPSNPTSQSPEVMLQRAMAMSGGANNGG